MAERGASEYRKAVDTTNAQCKRRHLNATQCTEKLKSLAIEKQQLDQSVAAVRKPKRDQEQSRERY
jgi:hypothetical protein